MVYSLFHIVVVAGESKSSRERYLSTDHRPTFPSHPVLVLFIYVYIFHIKLLIVFNFPMIIEMNEDIIINIDSINYFTINYFQNARKVLILSLIIEFHIG